MKKVIQYKVDGRLVYQDFEAHFIPTKGMAISFKKTSGIDSRIKEKEYLIESTILYVPNIVEINIKEW